MLYTHRRRGTSPRLRCVAHLAATETRMTTAFDARLTATYRLQFHKEFDFAAGARRAAYLRDLGVSHVYASPIMQAKPGSMHGYDVTDFAVINPELGGEAGLSRPRRGAAREGPRPDRRHRAQSHGGRRRRQPLLARPAGEGPRQRLRRLLRRRFRRARAQRQAAGAVPRQFLRRGARKRANSR